MTLATYRTIFVIGLMDRARPVNRLWLIEHHVVEYTGPFEKYNLYVNLVYSCRNLKVSLFVQGLHALH